MGKFVYRFFPICVCWFSRGRVQIASVMGRGDGKKGEGGEARKGEEKGGEGKGREGYNSEAMGKEKYLKITR